MRWLAAATNVAVMTSGLIGCGDSDHPIEPGGEAGSSRRVRTGRDGRLSMASSIEGAVSDVPISIRLDFRVARFQL